MSSNNVFGVDAILKFKKGLLKISDKILQASKFFIRFVEANFFIISGRNFIGVWSSRYS